MPKACVEWYWIQVLLTNADTTTHVSQKRLLPAGEVGEFTLTYDQRGKKVTLRCKVQDADMYLVNKYRAGLDYDKCHYYPQETKVFLELIEQENGRYATVRQSEPSGVQRKAVVCVDEHSVEEISRARELAQAPENARVTLSNFVNDGQKVEFEWED